MAPFQAWLLAKLVRRRSQIDLVHQFHVFHAGGAVACARLLVRKPLITTLIGWDTYDALRPLPRAVFPYLAWVMNRSDAVFAISAALVPHAQDQGCRLPITVRPLGSDLARFHPGADGSELRAELGLADDQVVALAVQRLDYRKRVDQLLQAMALCGSALPALRLVIVGNGPEREKLEALARELCLERRVLFAGFVPDADLPRYYAACDLFVLHSTYEGFGLVLADAMAAGKPVVAARVGGVPEVVAEGRTGILVNACRPDELAAALVRLGRDRAERERMGSAARRLAEEKLDWNRVTESYLSSYLALSARPA